MLIIFNLFFGWMFFKPLYWLAIEGILILLFVISSYIFLRRITSLDSKRDNAIDVKGEIVEEKPKLK